MEVSSFVNEKPRAPCGDRGQENDMNLSRLANTLRPAAARCATDLHQVRCSDFTPVEVSDHPSSNTYSQEYGEYIEHGEYAEYIEHRKKYITA